MQRFIKSTLLFAIPVFVAVGMVILVENDRMFAYNFIQGDCSGHGKWLYDRMYENNAGIDIAFLGSSATWNAIDDSALTSLLSERFNRPVQVANLGYCRLGTPLYSMLIEELIRTKKPKHIIVELIHRPAMSSHPMWGYLASTKQVLSPPTMFYQAYPTDLIKALTVRWEMLRAKLIPEREYRPGLSPFAVTRDPNVVDQDEMERIRKSRSDKNDLKRETFQEKLTFYLHWKNIDRIHQLCRDNGIQLSFVFINRFGRTLSLPRFYERYAAYGDVWLPPESVIQDPTNYFDPGHLNAKGASALTPFIFEELAQSEY